MRYEHRVKMKWNEEAKTEFKNQYKTLKVEVMDAPTMSSLASYIPEFGEATWEDRPRSDYSETERMECVEDMFKGKYVPTALETVNVTVRITGIDIGDVTHIIRHRSFSFSAQCTGDRDMRHDPVVMKPSIINSQYLDRFMALVDECKHLYAEMVDSKEIPLLDARTILPRCTETFYYMKGPLNAWIGFIKARSDIQIQPRSDVILAIKVYEALCELYPPMRGTIDIAGPDWWYINTVNTKRSSNMLYPREVNKEHVPDTHGSNFVYGTKTIGDFPGDHDFLDILHKHQATHTGEDV